jgi:fused signal recognition particle receptor
LAQGGWWRAALGRTRDRLGARLRGLFERTGGEGETWQALEETLLSGDVGVKATQALLDRARQLAGRKVSLRQALAQAMEDVLGESEPLRWAPAPPTVWMLVGVNGSGKTTTAGKLAAWAKAQGKRVVLAAADTYRAAAQEQLALWAQRTGADLVRGSEGGDPAAVAFDAVQAARARRADLVVVDTAGRLHTRRPLMDELTKVARVLGRAVADAPHECLLVLDATVGQNALAQVREFSLAVPVTGVVLAKMDSSARGGSALAVREELGVPVRLVGVGEGAEDLRPFDPRAYVEGLLADPPEDTVPS